MALKVAPTDIERHVPQLIFSWPACVECGSAGPFGVGKAITLPAGPSHGVVPVVCRSCGDVRLFPADSFRNEK